MSDLVVIGKKPIYSSKWGIDIDEWTLRSARDPSKVLDYLMIGTPDYVVVAGITPDNEIVMIVEDKPAEGLSLQLVAGGIKAGQSAQEAALAEFDEESNWEASEMIPLGYVISHTDRIYSLTPGNDGAKRGYMFMALNLSPSPQKLETTENIKSFLVPLETAVRAAIFGSPIPEIGLVFADATSVACVLRVAVTLHDWGRYNRYPF